METASLDDLIALNDQLAALIEAGMPLAVGLETTGPGAAAALERINATVARRVSRGASLVEALEADDPAVPPGYRHVMLVGLRSGDLYAGLDDSRRVAELVEKSRYSLRSALFYPLVVCCLALAGLVAFCLFFVPRLQEMHEGLQISVGPALNVLQTLRTTLPYWIIVPLIGVLVIAWQLRVQTSINGAGLLETPLDSGRSRFPERCAILADRLAMLIDAGVPLPEALPLASRACGDAGLSQAAETLADALRQGQPGEKSPGVAQFPPLLRWALVHSEATTGRSAALRLAANVYWEMAESRAERLRVLAPIIATAIIGGSAVLLYGLALFVPVVQMLEALGSPPDL
jgi:type II secretory pathway component PulF